MKTQALSTVTLQTIENCRHAATLTVEAYRIGSHRMIEAVNGGLERSVYSRTDKFVPQLTSTLTQFRSGLTDIVVKGVDGVSTGTEKAIEVSSNTAIKGVTQVAEFAAAIDNRVVVSGIEAATRLSLPGAKAVLAVSAKAVEGAGALSRVVAGKKAKVVRVAKKAVRAKRAVVRKTAAAKASLSRKTAAQRKAAKAPVARARRKGAEGVAVAA
jgi:hypothetical protein